MAFLVLLVVLNVLMFRTEATKEEDEEISSFVGEVQRRDETKRSSDITSLLNKLISDMEGMKGQILYEMPEQLEKQTEEMKKMADDIKNAKQLIIAQGDMAEDLKNLKEIVNRLQSSQELIIAQVKKTDVSIAKLCEDGTIKISESIRFHDQRLQNLSKEGICKSPMNQPRDCSDIRTMKYKSSGVYRVFINNTPRDVYCDFDTPDGDWLVFQRRRDGSVDFYRNWAAYTNGFGHVNGDFWLGNEILYQITSNRRYKLRIDLEDFDNQKGFAEYSSFSIGPLSDYYRLKIGSYSGNAGDSLTGHGNHQFSTYDVDRDAGPTLNCAEMFRGAWWYTACHASNLNGKFLRGNHSTYADGVNWYHWRGHHYSVKSEMKIALLN